MKTLAVLCQNPFSSSDGGAFCMRASLRKIDQKADLWVTGWGEDFNQVKVGPYRSAGSLGSVRNSRTEFLLALAAGRSYSIGKYAGRNARRIFSRIVEQGEFDVIWYEKLQAAGIGLRSRLLGRKPGPIHVLRAHNIEYSIFRDRFEISNWIERFLLEREERALRADELNVVSGVDIILNITSEDREEYGRESPLSREKLVLLPMFPETEGPSLRRKVLCGGFALFVGDCRWRPNLLAAEWIVDQLAPELLRSCPQVVLRLAGRGTEVFENRSPNVQAFGFVDDIEAEYSQAICTLAPVWHGGGVNIKVIDSLAHGVPVIGSAFARRGTFTDAYLQAETPAQFARQIDELCRNPQKAEHIGRLAQRDMEELEKRFHEFWHQYLD